MRTDDDGFTLLEALIAVGLMGVVFTVVSAAFVLGVSSSKDSTVALQESQAASFTSAYLTRDVQSARTVSLSTPRCGPVTGTLLLSVEWQDLAASTQAQGADYALQPVGDGSSQLVRTRCGSVNGVDVVARQLTAATVSCAPTSCARRVTVTLSGVLSASFSISADRRLA